jgi:hypothetical protein
VRAHVSIITICPMANSFSISSGTAVSLCSNEPPSGDEVSDITEHVVLLMALGSEHVLTSAEPTVSSGLSIEASARARFYKDGKRLTTAQGLTLVAGGLQFVLRDALERYAREENL